MGLLALLILLPSCNAVQAGSLASSHSMSCDSCCPAAATELGAPGCCAVERQPAEQAPGSIAGDFPGPVKLAGRISFPLPLLVGAGTEVARATAAAPSPPLLHPILRI